jgi:hypothetical protein
MDDQYFQRGDSELSVSVVFPSKQYRDIHVWFIDVLSQTHGIDCQVLVVRRNQLCRSMNM